MDLGGTVHCRTFLLLVPKMHVLNWKIYSNYPNHLKSLNPFQNLLSKLVRCTKNCNVCSWHWSKQRAQYSTTSDHMSHNQCFKSWMNWAVKFCLICRIHLTSCQPTCHLFKHLNNFLHGKHFDSQQETENDFQEFVKSRSMDFYATGINQLIYHWQKYVDCNGSYFD